MVARILHTAAVLTHIMVILLHRVKKDRFEAFFDPKIGLLLCYSDLSEIVDITACMECSLSHKNTTYLHHAAGREAAN
jgi:hypothetical protein